MNRLYKYLFGFVLILACTFVQKIQDGTMAYERKQYAVAADMLRNEYSKAKTRIEKGKIAYMLGDSYTALHKNTDAIDWYKIAYDNGAGIDALKAYAYALKKNEQYTEAQRAFKDLGIEIGSPYEYRKEISACKIASDWKKESFKAYTIQNVPWNSPQSDYAPVLYADAQVLFSSDRPASTGTETYPWTGNAFADLFVAEPLSNSVQPFPTPINTENNEGTATFNADFTEMVFTRCFHANEYQDRYCVLLQSSRQNDTWSVPTPLPFIQANINYGHPTMTQSGDQLYFSCNDPEGWGGYDIWMSRRTPEGWTVPTLLSRSINTTGDEKFPFIHADTLYFASNNHTGMGGLDIFRSYQIDDNQWSPVQNLKPPINSGSDDFGYIVDTQTPLEKGQLQVGYFTSTRLSGKGGDDIYRYEKIVPPPPPEEPKEPEEIVYTLLLKGYVVEKIYEDANNPNSRVLGRKPIPATAVDINTDGKKTTVQTNENGFFELSLDFDKDYTFFAKKEGYLNNDARFSTKGIAKDPNFPNQTFELEILLDKIFVNKEIVLENIYYDFDKADIRSDAEPTLNELTKLLRQNPTLNIQLSAHTDCRGNPNYNQRLSQDRAQSVVNYLVNAGIQSQRLSAVGYGENNLLIDCPCNQCTEEEHQANRRTTFKIIE